MDATQKACCEALEHHFSEQQGSGLVGEKHDILIMQGVPGDYLKRLPKAQIHAVTYCARTARAWKKLGIQTSTTPQGKYDQVIQFATKSDSETKLSLGLGLQALKDEGQFTGVIHNRMGASRYKKQLASIFGEIHSLSKSKAKVFYPERSNSLQPPSFEKLALPQPVGESSYLSLPGVYGEKAIDQGSELLASLLRNEYWSGIGTDLGCGFGYLSGEILKTNHRIKELWLFDIDLRAIEMAKLNLADQVKLKPHWLDIHDPLPIERPVHWVVMNPPFHSGISQDFNLGKAFIRQAASILRPGGPLFMVANQHLPYEETLHEQFRSVVLLKQENGFKCFKALR